MASLYGTQFTDQWLANPWSTEPSQFSNQFSNFNNAALPYPPTYNPGLAGGPVNAATGQPIQSFQDWQKANPGGLNLNATPAQPQAPVSQPGTMNINGVGQPTGGANNSGGYGAGIMPQGPVPSASPMVGTGAWMQPQQAPAAPQQSGPPNNWQAAIDSLARPGPVTTQGATVPMMSGSQPSGGINSAFLQQARGQPGMNQRFMSALAAIQGRPQ